ncbi:phenylalanine--tRNA ligase subunit alpha [Zavarzinia sp. CC-PAN008]|uniref:phenylalanine--tRNA ligase subunit alpha n=1 Tax=Zavarzinia sp. CC-PAN008 TaxID=3243332 RepID=UPI003F74931C
MDDLVELERDLTAAVAAAADLEALERLRVAALGKKGTLTERMKTLGALDPDTRKAVGARLNAAKDALADAIAARRTALAEVALEAKLAAERIDVTLAPHPAQAGRIHPVSQVIDEITEIFADMGFAVAEGPDIEEDFYNFTALNMPPEHPARQMHDTFYLPARADGTQMVLRTHTSPVQIRTMLAGPPPHRVICPGRTFRLDSDQTHTPMFHQVEALVIDRAIHMGHLKGAIEHFARTFFEVPRVTMRFRPSYFPFTEPSAEVDIGCDRSGGTIRIGEGSDWLEIMGCGMVHPNVLRACNLDPDEWQGFAFGMGIDRIAMLKYGAPDLRAFFASDLRWLRHYGFSCLDVPTLAQGLSR